MHWHSLAPGSFTQRSYFEGLRIVNSIRIRSLLIESLNIGPLTTALREIGAPVMLGAGFATLRVMGVPWTFMWTCVGAVRYNATNDIHLRLSPRRRRHHTRELSEEKPTFSVSDLCPHQSSG